MLKSLILYSGREGATLHVAGGSCHRPARLRFIMIFKQAVRKHPWCTAILFNNLNAMGAMEYVHT